MLFVTLACLLTVVSAAITEEGGVLVLTDSNFAEAIAEHNSMLVEFYAPWCGHCKSLAPEYEKAAKTMADSDAKLAKVDATEEKTLGAQFEIKGFPTLKYFRNGKPSEYTGGRTASEIVSWMAKKSGPAAKPVNSEDELDTMQDTNDVVVVGVFDSETSDMAKAFLDHAGADDNLVYAITTNEAVKAKLAVTGETVVVLKSFDDLRNDMAVSTWDDEAVTTFLAGASTPLIQTFSPESSKKIFGSPVTKHCLFFTNVAADHHAATMDTFKAVAGDYKGRALFVNVPSTEKRVMDYFELKESDLPKMVFADMGHESGMRKFPFEGAMDQSSVTAFITAFFDGTLVPHLKSEAVEADDTTGDVTVLRGTSFEELVINNTNDVLVEFYAPWCGHCKQLAPVYEEVGKEMKSLNSHVTIAKMDATANEVSVPGLAVKGYPTLFFFKGNDKAHPVKYEAGREVKDFIAYLKENAHNSFGADHDEL